MVSPSGLRPLPISFPFILRHHVGLVQEVLEVLEDGFRSGGIGVRLLSVGGGFCGGWRGHAGVVEEVLDVLDEGFGGGGVEVQFLVILHVGRRFCGGGRDGELPLLLTLGEWRGLGFHAGGDPVVSDREVLVVVDGVDEVLDGDVAYLLD